MVSAMAQIMAVKYVFMLPKLRRAESRTQSSTKNWARELAMVNYPTRQGLYYHPGGLVAGFTKRRAAFGTAISNAVNKLSSPNPPACYYNQAKWSNYMGRNSTLQAEKYRYRTEWALLQQAKPGLITDNKTAVLAEPDSETTRAKDYYITLKRGRKWRIKTAQATPRAQETPAPRKGLLYDPAGLVCDGKSNGQADTKFSEKFKTVSIKDCCTIPKQWQNFMKQTTMAEAKAIDAKPARAGIFYDSQKCSDDLRAIDVN